MAYDNPGPDVGDETPSMPPDEMHEGGEMVDVTMLIPKGMDVKDGEVLEFRVHKDGDKIMAEYNTGEESWEDGLRKEMSPRTGGSEMEQEGM